jgi:hypothetical protein
MYNWSQNPVARDYFWDTPPPPPPSPWVPSPWPPTNQIPSLLGFPPPPPPNHNNFYPGPSSNNNNGSSWTFHAQNPIQQSPQNYNQNKSKSQSSSTFIPVSTSSSSKVTPTLTKNKTEDPALDDIDFVGFCTALDKLQSVVKNNEDDKTSQNELIRNLVNAATGSYPYRRHGQPIEIEDTLDKIYAAVVHE